MDMLEFLKTENFAFKRKLQSKSEALLIIQNQLIVCQQELDILRRSRKDGQNGNASPREHIGQIRLSNVEITNKKLTDENKLLLFDIEDLKQKLNDANNDIKVLKKQQRNNANHVIEKSTTTTSCIQHLEQLEHLNRKCSQLEQDLQILLDEKQDLVKQRDTYYDKMQRLNIQIKNVLNISSHNVDFDAIVMENKYLKQRLEDLLVEKKLWTKTVSKYKNILSNNYQNTGKILSYDQIAKHINTMTSSISTSKKPEANNLKQICITLLETLNEKNLLLQHQRKTNKILANRILELENRNGTRENACDVLLKGYSATGIIATEEIDGIERTNESSQLKKTNGMEENMAIGYNKCNDFNTTNGIVEDCTKTECLDQNKLDENSLDINDHDKNALNKTQSSNETQESFDISEIDTSPKQRIQTQGCELDKNQSKKETDLSFEDNEDIQSLPLELQKLVLQAMKDLENDELKT